MRRFVLIIVLLLPEYVSAQRIKFRDLFPLLATYSPDRQKNELKEFIMTELDHPNANLRLAILYSNNYKNADPLTEYSYALANANQAKIRYLKARQVVDAREANRNEEYYAPLYKMFDAKGKPAIEFPVIAAKMNEAYDSANLFLTKIPPIYSSFTKSVNFYDQSVIIFSAITKEFTSSEDLYLMSNESVDMRFSKLKQNYDSSIIYLNKYLALIKEYPINGHKPSYKVKPIVTYRLDGLLTNINFLTDNIELWDYSEWVNQVRKKVNIDVTDLRKKLIIANEKMDDASTKIGNSFGPTFPLVVKVDKQLAFHLNNLDRQSVALSLLEYKSLKQELDIQNKSKSLDTTFTNHNAAVISQLIYSNRKADTLVRDFKDRVTISKVNKHKDFVEKFYGGLPGLEKYAIAQQQVINNGFAEDQQILQNNVVNLTTADQILTNKEGAIKSGRFSIPLILQTTTPEALDQGLLITKFNRKNPDGSAYVAGIFKPDKKKNLVSTYLVKVNPDGKPGWFKEINISIDSAVQADANSFLGPIVLTQEGSAFVIHSVHLTRGDVVNTFVYLNEKGEEKLKKRLENKSYPRELLYAEKSNSFVLFLKGTQAKEKYNLPEPVDAIGVNVLGEITWKKEGLVLTGTLNDVISLSDGYLLAGNYFSLNDQNGKEIKTKSSSGECSPYVIKLSERGVLIFSKPIPTTTTFFLHRLTKINDMSIHLLGHAETMEAGLGSSLKPAEKVLHIMTNKLGQLIFSNY